MKNIILIKKENKKRQCLGIFQKKNSAGQFYLIATIILIGLIISFALINNYSSNKDPRNLKQMAEELKIEGEKVLDYDIINSQLKFEEFSRDYSVYAGENKEIYFILVETDGSFQAYKYDGTVKTDLRSDLQILGDKIIFSLEESNYEFKKEAGKNFYFVLVQEEGDEKYVISG